MRRRMSALGHQRTWRRAPDMSTVTRKQTLLGATGQSALCQKETSYLPLILIKEHQRE